MVTPLSPTGEGAALSVRGVTKTYRAPDGSPVVALYGLTLAVAAGEMLALVGPSGCGQSTLLRLISGLEPPTAGHLRVGAEPIAGPGRRG